MLDRDALIATAVNLYKMEREAIVNCIAKMEIRLHHRLIQQAVREGIPCTHGSLTADALPELLLCHPDLEVREIEANTPSGRARPGTVGQKGLFATRHIKPYTILGSYQGVDGGCGRIGHLVSVQLLWGRHVDATVDAT